MTTPIYLSAREAAAELGVQPATLYAYVSRGLIRSVPGPGKQRRYDAADVRRLQDRRGSENTGDAKPLSGDPVLETHLTLIAAGGPYYRGVPATNLARSSSLEAVATLLWDCENNPFGAASDLELPLFPDAAGPIERAMTALAVWPLSDPAAYTLSPDLLRNKGAVLVRYVAAALLARATGSALLHEHFAETWNVGSGVADLLRAILVLCADHELNTSAFAVRCAASTRAPLHAAILSGLGAFTGPRHGSASDRVGAWLSEIRCEKDIERVLGARLRRGEQLPGFGHAIYKEQDPRAECLLMLLQERFENSRLAGLVPAICRQAKILFGVHPNIDFALTVTQRAFSLPEDSAKILFCAGRTVGWIAHALEQYGAQEQIRPRASYVGERPKGLLL